MHVQLKVIYNANIFVTTNDRGQCTDLHGVHALN